MQKRFIDFTKRKRRKFRLSKPGLYVVFFFNLSGEVEIELSSKKAEAYIFGVFIGKKSKKFNLKTVQHHIKEGSKSNL